jgi:hypothetical protein
VCLGVYWDKIWERRIGRMRDAWWRSLGSSVCYCGLLYSCYAMHQKMQQNTNMICKYQQPSHLQFPSIAITPHNPLRLVLPTQTKPPQNHQPPQNPPQQPTSSPNTLFRITLSDQDSSPAQQPRTACSSAIVSSLYQLPHFHPRLSRLLTPSSWDQYEAINPMQRHLEHHRPRINIFRKNGWLPFLP